MNWTNTNSLPYQSTVPLFKLFEKNENFKKSTKNTIENKTSLAGNTNKNYFREKKETKQNWDFFLIRRYLCKRKKLRVVRVPSDMIPIKSDGPPSRTIFRLKMSTFFECPTLRRSDWLITAAFPVSATLAQCGAVVVPQTSPSYPPHCGVRDALSRMYLARFPFLATGPATQSIK